MWNRVQARRVSPDSLYVHTIIYGVPANENCNCRYCLRHETYGIDHGRIQGGVSGFTPEISSKSIFIDFP